MLTASVAARVAAVTPAQASTEPPRAAPAPAMSTDLSTRHLRAVGKATMRARRSSGSQDRCRQQPVQGERIYGLQILEGAA
jgi:hypothetical protein